MRIHPFTEGMIQSLRDNLIDADLLVDRARQDVDRAVEVLRTAVQRRDLVARDLVDVCREALA